MHIDRFMRGVGAELCSEKCRGLCQKLIRASNFSLLLARRSDSNASIHATGDTFIRLHRLDGFIDMLISVS